MKGTEDDVLSGITVKLNRLKTINKKHNRQKRKNNRKKYISEDNSFGILTPRNNKTTGDIK